LTLVGLCILLDLLFRQSNPRFRDSARIADHAREVADEKNDFMAEILKVLHLMKQDGMSEMQVRGGGIEAGFYSERAMLLCGPGKFAFQLALLDDLRYSAEQPIHLMVGFVHRSCRFVLDPLHRHLDQVPASRPKARARSNRTASPV